MSLAKEYNLFILCDEIYTNIVYNGARSYKLAEVIEDVPGIAMKGISKEYPWPGSRCGWLEFYNRDHDKDFNHFCQTLEQAKQIEVCSTTLPQLSIPKVMSDPRYLPYRLELNEEIGKRSRRVSEILGEVPELIFNPTYGAFSTEFKPAFEPINAKTILRQLANMVRVRDDILRHYCSRKTGSSFYFNQTQLRPFRKTDI